MTDLKYFVLILLMGIGSIIFEDTTISIIVMAAAILGIGCELNDKSKKQRGKYND